VSADDDNFLSSRDRPLSAPWFNAFTLHERIRCIRNGHEHHAAAANGGRPLLAKWRSQPPFDNQDFFSKRLHAEDIREAEFIQALSQEPGPSCAQAPGLPQWLIDLDDLYLKPGSLGSVASQSSLTSGAGFLELCMPIIKKFKRQLSQHVETVFCGHPEGPGCNGIVELLAKSLYVQMLRIVTRTLVLELNVHRVRGLLKGETAEERFHSYIHQLSSAQVRSSLMCEYPLLGRQIWECANRWLRFSSEIVERLHSDWRLLSQQFQHDFGSDQLADIVTGAGDTHRGGRSVTIISFASGFRLVYKPRSLSTDTHFNNLLEWCNTQDIRCKFLQVGLVDRGTYGWMEYVEAKDPQSRREVERFYYRLGALLAVLHLLNATDCHFENVIAHGEHPVFIDTETLFHAPSKAPPNAPVRAFLQQVGEHTVLRVGLLPQRFWAGKKEGGIDLSAVGGSSGQLTPGEVLTSEFDGTDEMRVVHKRVKMDGAHNRPRLSGKEVNPSTYTAEMTSGFRDLYDLFSRKRNELIADHGPLEWFANDDIRFIIRPTKIYAQILLESYHPNLLRNGLDRDRFLDRLWVTVRERPEIAPLIPAEQKDLRAGDVPIFATKPASRDVWMSYGTTLANHFTEPALEIAKRRLAVLSQADRERQVSLIRSSLATVAPSSPDEQKVRAALDECSNPVDPQQLLEAAREIAERLTQAAYINDAYAIWIGPKLVSQSWTVEPVGDELYDGASGISLFLAQAGRQLNESRYTDLARKAIRYCIDSFWEDDTTPAASTLTGAFGGKAGLVYVLTKLSSLWNDHEFLDEALRIAAALAARLQDDTQLDISNGNAGVLCVLCNLCENLQSENARNAAKLCADFLITHATLQAEGAGWITPIAAKPLTGFAHGAAGIAHALLRFASLDDDPRYSTAARAAMAYETSQRVSNGSNWRDLRDTEVMDDSGRMGWCHGAPGIGLSRIAAARFLSDPLIELDITTSLQAALEWGLGGNDCLCHGNFSLLNFLFEAALHRKDAKLARYVRCCCQLMFQSTARHGWRCDAPGGAEVFGLMQGLSGIGYSLLRFADPQQVPCILLLE